MAPDAMRALFECCPFAILIADDAGRYVDANAAAARLFGHPQQELIGKTVLDYVDPKDVVPVQAMWGTFRSTQYQSGEFPLRRPDGSHRVLRYWAVASFVPGKHASFLEDVTEEKVDHDVRARFIATLTHDLRTPLAAVRMGAQIIQRQPDDADNAAKHAERIVRNVDRASSLIDNLLDASRVTAGEPLGLKLDECDLSATVRAHVEELTTIHGGRLKLNDFAPIRTRADCSAIGRALSNLVDNAFKYGDPRGDVEVRIVAKEDEVEIAVRNKGRPIPADDRAKIFEPYLRGNDGSVRGWGLGLTLVRGVAEAHGGSIAVESDATSTTFTLRLPAFPT